jgi:hypothetical protein
MSVGDTGNRSDLPRETAKNAGWPKGQHSTGVANRLPYEQIDGGKPGRRQPNSDLINLVNMLCVRAVVVFQMVLSASGLIVDAG